MDSKLHILHIYRCWQIVWTYHPRSSQDTARLATRNLGLTFYRSGPERRSMRVLIYCPDFVFTHRLQAETYLSAVARPLLVIYKSSGAATCRHLTCEGETRDEG